MAHLRTATPSTRRGFSLLEVTLAVVLIIAITGFLVVTYRSSSDSGDEQARFSVSVALDAEIAHWREWDAYGDAADIADLLPRLTAVDAPTASDSSSAVSVGASPQLVGLAAIGSTRCWLARLTPTGVLWATQDLPGVTGIPACTGTAATTVTVDPAAPQRGRSPDTPIRIG